MNTREKLVEAAIELILKQGYFGVGVQEICQYANVRKGSFYHHFASKSDLTLAAIQQHWIAYQAPIVACANAPIQPFARVELLFTKLHQLYQGRLEEHSPLTGCPFATLAMELSIHDEQLRHALEDVFTAWAKIFEQIFIDAIAANETSPDINPERAARALLAYLEGVLMLVKASQNPNHLLELKPSVQHLQALGK